jgi:hypothetical protein
MDEQGWLPKLGYYLDESDPDVVVLRRQDGSFVAAFSARGATREGIVEAAQEDYQRLVSRLRVDTERASFLDELPEHVAIVERSGTILAVNEAWNRFAKDNEAEDARSFAGGLRSVLSDTEERFAMEYPCHSPTERRWFVGSVGRLSDGDTPLALVAHENVSGCRIRR